jgi:hypothetical protein
MKSDAYSNEQIKAIGVFLSNYHSDLTYIQKFQEFIKKGKLEGYAIKGNSSLYTFLSEFQIIRNIKQGKVPEVLPIIYKFCKGKSHCSVDELAKDLKDKGITHGTATSLASKILFLNNPTQILPSDRWVKKALKRKGTSYDGYIIDLDNYKKINEKLINRCMQLIKPFALIIEKDFADIDNIDVIRENRFIDKLLWASGKAS